MQGNVIVEVKNKMNCKIVLDSNSDTELTIMILMDSKKYTELMSEIQMILAKYKSKNKENNCGGCPD